ncbi:MAG: NAD(P)-dependent glycerol-3-phosphate dehydrogenase [Oscillospiraceae bacterium]|nr:NAD(P)-dependent glycerol-3-phosphate dehydrogenase [Oscillospiraceae bacterium]
MNAVVLGSGGWGTALAMLLRDNGHCVTLWSHSAEKAKLLQDTRENPLLCGVTLPDEIEVTSELAPLRRAELIVFATPSFALRETAAKAAPQLPDGALLVSVTKGIEPETHLRMSQLVREETGGGYPVVALSGPSHAEEVARRIPTGCVAAAETQPDAQRVQSAFMNDVFRVYTHDDMVGVELAGALKNVVALCCGIADGCGFGDNAKALLMTRALTEMSRLAERLGGRRDTLAGLAGVGDLIVTCTSMHSRNRRAGILVGQGKSAEEAMREIGAVVEGWYACRSARELSDELNVEMPICRAVYDVLFEGAEVAPTVHALMRRQPKREIDSCWI